MSSTLREGPLATSADSTPPAEPRTNTVFAFEPDKSGAFTNPFSGTRRITLSARGGIEPCLEVVAGAGAQVEALYDEATHCCAYRWGVAAHSEIASSDLLKWVIDVVQSDDLSPLREVVGNYVILIDDRSAGRIRLISDILGLRPWFVGKRNGKLLCGSDVWAIADAGVDMGSVNYDAVASWLRFLWDCTGQSLFSNFPAIGYGVVGTWENEAYRESRYFTLVGAWDKPSMPELLEGMHRCSRKTFDALTRDASGLTIALSGGFDSRYLAAMGSRRNLKMEAFCVGDRYSEDVAAKMVAQALGMEIRILRTDGTEWGMFAEPYHFTAGGFPITRQLSHFAVAQRPGTPCLNGFFGDPINRGSLDRVEDKTERQIPPRDLPSVYQRYFTAKHTVCRFDLIDPGVVRRADERILALLRQRLGEWDHTTRPLLCVNLFFHQRFFMSNNVLQHLHVADAITPFVSWEHIQYKLRVDPELHGYDTYGRLLATHFPEIGKIPHNAKIAGNAVFKPAASRCTREWAGVALTRMLNPRCLPLVSRRKAVPRLFAALMGRRNVEVVALFLYRLYLLDARLRGAGIAFDWKAI